MKTMGWAGVRVGTLALALYLVAVSIAAVAQPTGKVYRIDLLRYFAWADQFGLKDLRQRLGELGYVEGRNVVIECRAAPGTPASLAARSSRRPRRTPNSSRVRAIGARGPVQFPRGRPRTPGKA
jgi:Fe2+ transport system protein FeoA